MQQIEDEFTLHVAYSYADMNNGGDDLLVYEREIVELLLLPKKLWTNMAKVVEKQILDQVGLTRPDT
jgi:hypothetical protein